MYQLLVIPPPRIPWLLVWIVFFITIYRISWKKIPLRNRRKAAIIILLLPTAILLPLHFWGTYNLTGLNNGGFFVFGFSDWGTLFSLPPETTYKSETLSNLYALGGDELYFTTTEEIHFYLVDENVPDVQYEWQNSSEVSESYYGTGFAFTLPYYYTNFSFVANWTFNIYNPSPNATVDVTVNFFGCEDKNTFWWSRTYIQYQEPTVGLLSFWMVGLIAIPIVYSHFRKEVFIDSA